MYYGNRRGDIVHSEYATKAKEYAWNKLRNGVLPRGISPTDIDAAIEVGERMLFFEMKTSGSAMPDGQRLFFERLLAATRASLIIVDHPRIDPCDVCRDVTAIEAWTWEHSAASLPRLLKTGHFPCSGDQLRHLLTVWTQSAERRNGAFATAVMQSIGLVAGEPPTPLKRVGGKAVMQPFKLREADCDVAWYDASGKRLNPTSTTQRCLSME